MNEKKFIDWLSSKDLPEKAELVIHQIRSSQPVRSTAGKRGNITGVFPSIKMGVGIQFESHKLELAGIWEKELDEKVLEYYDQPSKLKLNYTKANGKKGGHLYTPDFFVIEENWIGWEEWKQEEDLMRLAKERPHLYMKDSDDKWRLPPAEKAAEKFGLSFRVHSSKDVNWVFQKNVIFLKEYLDRPFEVKNSARVALLEIINTKPSITLLELIEGDNSDFTVDDIHQLIANNEIVIDVKTQEIEKRDSLNLYPSIETLKANKALSEKPPSIREEININSLEIKPGTVIQWGTELVEIKMVMNDRIVVEKDGENTDFKLSYFEELIMKGHITGLASRNETEEQRELKKKLLSADEEDIREALRKYEYVKRALNGEPFNDIPIKKRTLYRWVKRYKDAEKVYGFGLVGLYSNTHLKGNRKRKLDLEVVDLMNEMIEKVYENYTQKNIRTVYKQLQNKCEERGYQAPSDKTFSDEVKKRPIYEQTLKRKGRRGAYTLKEQFHPYLDESIPVHGSRPFEVVHIDHTPLDIQLLSQDGEVLGRPELTLAVDAFSRRILAFHLSFDPPSHRSSMMVLREMVRRFKRMPASIVVDNGKDFQSIYFEQLLLWCKTIKKNRPPADPRAGSVIERLFRTNDQQFVHNLMGNTKMTKNNVRQVTKSTNPKNNAVWTFRNFYNTLEEYFYEVYDNAHHTTLGMSPSQLYLKEIEISGKRTQSFITDNEMFRMLSMPTPIGDDTRIVQVGTGVKINRFYYWCQEFSSPAYYRKKVLVRYDPYDMSKAYAFVDRMWVQLRSQHYYKLLNGRTEREIRIISEELKKKNSQNEKKKKVTDIEIAKFLERAETTQTLELQRKKDREMKELQQVKNIKYKAEPSRNSVAIKKESISVLKNGSEPIEKDKKRDDDVNDFIKLIKNNEIVGYEEF